MREDQHEEMGCGQASAWKAFLTNFQKQMLRRARGRRGWRPWGTAPRCLPRHPTHVPATAPASNDADWSPRGAEAAHGGVSSETWGRPRVVWPPGEPGIGRPACHPSEPRGETQLRRQSSNAHPGNVCPRETNDKTTKKLF